MDHNDQAQRMYQQHMERNQSAMHNAYPAANIAARFRHPSSAQSSSSAEVSPTFGGQSHGYLESGHLSGGSLQGGYQYPQFTAAEPVTYASQPQQQAPQYSQSYFYSTQQATSSADPTLQDHAQRYQAAVARNSSIASTSSQYSLPHTPQSQYFGSSQGNSFPTTRPGDTGTQSSTASFDSMQYTQPGYSASYEASGQMLPPSSYGTHGARSQRQNMPSVTDVDEAYETYQTKAKEIFTLVQDGKLRETHDLLMYISQYLLGNAEGLGLDKDDKQLYEERLKLWAMFNNTWLTTLQAQLDNTRELMELNAQAPQHPRSLLTVDEMEMMGHELVRLCDGIAHFGLVDYQMGVEEERILELLIKCIDLIEPGLPDTPRTAHAHLRYPVRGPPR